jgi:vitamin B12 transporter
VKGAWRVLLVAALAVRPAAGGEPSAVELPPVVVSASRLPGGASELPASVTIIDRDEIEARQPESVLELLRTVPGVFVEQAGGRGGVTSLFTRGGDPNYTLVLIDGVRVNDPTNSRGGSFDFSTLDPQTIERVEVLRGPLSAVHGSDAMSGVVNVVTRAPPRPPGAAIEAGGGRYGWHRVGATGGGRFARGDVSLGASYVDEGDPVPGNVFRGATAYATARAAHGPARVRLVGRFAQTDGESFPDDSGGPELAVRRAVDRRERDEGTLGLVPALSLASWLDAEVQATYYERRETLDSPGVAPGVRDPFGIPPNQSRDRFRRETVTARALAVPGDRVQLTAGVDVQLEQGTSESRLDVPGGPLRGTFRLERETWAPFAEMRLVPLADLVLHAGGRVDVPSDFDSEVSPWVGARYTVRHTATTLHASWGRAFKLPSFFALGNPIVGNPDLRPETGESVEAGVRQETAGGRVGAGVTWFDSRYERVIDLDEGPPPRLVNRSRVDAWGVELSADARPHDTLVVRAQATHVETDIAGTDEELRGRPEWSGALTVEWRPLPAVAGSVAAAYAGSVRDSSIPTGDRRLDDYVEVNVALAWAVTRHVSLTLAVTNVLDRDYERAIGFPAPGVWPRAGVRVGF